MGNAPQPSFKYDLIPLAYYDISPRTGDRDMCIALDNDKTLYATYRPNAMKHFVTKWCDMKEDHSSRLWRDLEVSKDPFKGEEAMGCETLVMAASNIVFLVQINHCTREKRLTKFEASTQERVVKMILVARNSLLVLLSAPVFADSVIKVDLHGRFQKRIITSEASVISMALVRECLWLLYESGNMEKIPKSVALPRKTIVNLCSEKFHPKQLASHAGALLAIGRLSDSAFIKVLHPESGATLCEFAPHYERMRPFHPEFSRIHSDSSGKTLLFANHSRGYGNAHFATTFKLRNKSFTQVLATMHRRCGKRSVLRSAQRGTVFEKNVWRLILRLSSMF